MNCDLSREVSRVLEGFQKTWEFDGRDFNKPTADEVLHQLIKNAPENARERLTAEFFHEGPLTPYLELPHLQEIIINGREEIWLEDKGQMRRVPDSFLSDLTYKNFADRLCSEAGIKVDLAQPFCNGRWRDFRVHIGCAPLTHCDLHISLRRLPSQPWTLEKLAASVWAAPEQIELLRGLVRERKNILFIGPTGCGKTTVLGACLQELAPSERVVILEDTDELTRPNSASTKMLTRPPSTVQLPEVGLSELVRQSLRMRPSRLVMGEVRGSEAKDLLLALATGHSGSLGTLHAADARQALLRLEMLVQLGAPQWNVQAVRQLIQLSVDVLVVCENKNGHRRLLGIYKVAALESFGFLLEPLIS
jgi:pilus assembly protein CpaF